MPICERRTGVLLAKHYALKRIHNDGSSVGSLPIGRGWRWVANGGKRQPRRLTTDHTRMLRYLLIIENDVREPNLDGRYIKTVDPSVFLRIPC